MWSKVLLVFACGLIVIGGLMLLPEPEPAVLESTGPIELGWDMRQAETLSFVHEGSDIIVIDMETGKVTLAEGLELDEASRKFWRLARQHFVPCPSLEEEEGP